MDETTVLKQALLRWRRFRDGWWLVCHPLDDSDRPCRTGFRLTQKGYTFMGTRQATIRVEFEDRHG